MHYIVQYNEIKIYFQIFFSTKKVIFQLKIKRNQSVLYNKESIQVCF